MLLVLVANLFESSTLILIIGFKSQRLVLITVEFLTLFLVFVIFGILKQIRVNVIYFCHLRLT